MGANGNGGMTGLSADKIAELLAGRQRGQYEPKLEEFLSSDEAGIDPRQVWPLEFGKKEASSIYQGFNTARKKLETPDVIRITRQENEVFILHVERAALLATAE